MAGTTPSLKGEVNARQTIRRKVNVKSQHLYLRWINRTFFLYLLSRFRMGTMKNESVRHKRRCQPERCFPDRKINFTTFAFGWSVSERGKRESLSSDRLINHDFRAMSLLIPLKFPRKFDSRLSEKPKQTYPRKSPKIPYSPIIISPHAKITEIMFFCHAWNI